MPVYARVIQVRDAMNDRRSTAANRVRKTCAATIFPRELLLRSWGERKLLLGYKEPAEGEMSCSWEPLDARILHDGSDGEWEDNGSEFNPATFMRGDEPQLVRLPLMSAPLRSLTRATDRLVLDLWAQRGNSPGSRQEVSADRRSQARGRFVASHAGHRWIHFHLRHPGSCSRHLDLHVH
jgi:hypothetical protein